MVVVSHQAFPKSTRQFPACPTPLHPLHAEHNTLALMKNNEQPSFDWKGNSTAPYTYGQACTRSGQWPHRAVVPQELRESFPQPGTLAKRGSPPGKGKYRFQWFLQWKSRKVSSFKKCGRNKETSHRDVCRDILEIPVHLHIYWEVMPLLLADLSTWAFSCICALKASSWLSKPSRCWTWFYPFFHSKSNQKLLAIRHGIYSSVKGKIYIQALFFHTIPYLSNDNV